MYMFVTNIRPSHTTHTNTRKRANEQYMLANTTYGQRSQPNTYIQTCKSVLIYINLWYAFTRDVVATSQTNKYFKWLLPKELVPL